MELNTCEIYNIGGKGNLNNNVRFLGWRIEMVKEIIWILIENKTIIIFSIKIDFSSRVNYTISPQAF